MTTLKEIIGTAAAKHGIDPTLAEATAWHESGLNPQAVGDNDTSFGLYQLHEGGELGNLTKEEAFNPQTNADVALTEFANVHRSNPDLKGGALAAAAQRPGDPTAYIAAVNTIVGEIQKGNSAINEALAKEVGGTAPDPTNGTGASSSVPAPQESPIKEVTYCTPSIPQLDEGDKGYPVRILQLILGGNLSVDGVFGPLTLAAVKSFQRSKGLEESGTVGLSTWENLIGRQIQP